MGTSDSVTYVWTDVDRATATGNPPAWDTSGYVTPYLLRPAQVPDAATIQPGSKIQVDRTKSEQKLYNSFFARQGYEWIKIPDGIKGATVEDLCAALLASDPKGSRFPALYYDLNAKNKVWPGGIPIWRLLFDYWGNTEYRYAHTKAKGDFRWSDITPKLATDVGGQQLTWVLALAARVEEIHAAPAVAQVSVAQVKKIDSDLAPPKMKVGINHPWAFNAYGSSLGPHAPWIDRWFACLDENLAKAKNEWNVEYVRLWILCNGYNYGTATRLGGRPILSLPPWSLGLDPKKLEEGSAARKYVEQTQGDPILRAPYDWRFDPPSKLDDKFLQDFRRVLASFKSAGCRIIPSLIDFGAFIPIPAGGKRDLVVDKAKRAIFMNTVLEEFLRVSEDFKGQIYAWEVMNEPSWTTRPFAKPMAADKMGVFQYMPDVPILSDSELNDFLQEALGRIEAHGFASTVGHRTFSDMLTYKTGQRKQFHFYGWPLMDNPGAREIDLESTMDLKRWLLSDRIPTYRGGGLDDKENTFVGEVGAGDHGLPWSEFNGADKGSARTRVFERLRLVARKGYPLALLWGDTHWNPPSNNDLNTAVDRFCYSDDAVLGLTDFTHGLFPGGVP